ncbi:MAG: leucine-rich repeat protein [Clostridia bacterium]|nr:leucine-rich repeat protein [Clostridia bacterium]
MKKTKLSTILLSVLALFCSIFVLASCDGDDHTHNYSNEWSKDATYHWQACSGCEETRNKAEHDWNSGIVTQQPTETSEGSRAFTCNTCGHTKVESIPVLDTHEHTFSETWSFNETHHWYSATCEHITEKKDYAEHNWNSGVITTEPTTTSKGIKTFTCESCNKTKTEDIPKLEEIHSHVYNQQNIDVQYIESEATCTEKAVYFYSCLCGLKGTETFEYGESKGHNYDIDNIAWSWSNYDSAIATVSCIDNENHTRNITASITEKTTKDANCGEAGEKIYTASIKIDGETYTNEKKEILPALEHDFDISTLAWQWNGFSAASVVLICQNDHNHQQSFNATITSKIEDEPSCTVGGLKRYTATVEIDNAQYSDEKTETLPANGHTYNADGIEWIWTGYETAAAIATCAEDCGHSENLTAVITSEVTTPVLCTVNGEKTYTATIELDGNTYTNQTTEELVAPGHDWNEGETTKEPSEEEDGVIAYSCSGCTETYTEVIRSAGKNNWNTAFENAESMTNVTVIGGATFTYGDESSTGESKWYLDGYKMYIYSKEIDANNAENYYEFSEYYEQIDGVNYCYYEDNGEWLKEIYEWDVDYSVEFLCSTEFLTQLKNSFDRFNYDKATHTYSAPNFEIVLSSTYSNISLVIVDGVLTQFIYTMTDEDMVGTVTMTFQNYGTTAVTLPHIHDWDDGTITTEPTETESGIKTYSCSGCSETKTEIVYAQSQSSWNSAFEKAKTTTNVTVNINTVIENGDETIEAYAFYLLDNYKLYMFSRIPASGGGYYVDEYYYAKIDGINYEFEEEYSNGAWVWVKTEYSYDDIPYVLGDLVLPSTLWTELKNSYAEFEYDINTNTYSSTTKTMDLYGMTISNISVIIENGTLVGFNYTMTYEDGRVQKQEATYTEYGTTVVELPEAVPACTHSFTVLDPSNLCLCCEFCDEYLRVSEVESVYIGDTIRFIGDVVTKEDISITLYYENGTVLNCTNFTLNDTTLQYRTNSVQIICGDDYWYDYVQVYAYPVGSSFTEEGFVYVEENATISIIGYRGTNTNVIVPETINSKPVTVIDEDAFYGSNIENIVLPESLVRIGSYAFANTKLTTIMIPKNVTTIGGCVFSNCNELTSIVFEDTIGWSCYRYIDVTDAERNVIFLTDRGQRYYWYKYSYEAPKEFENTDGFLYTVENGEVTIVDYIGNLDNFTVPSEIETMPVVAIGQGAFASLNVTNIELSEGIRTIYAHAFDSCSNLTNLIIPQSVTSIGVQAFMQSGITEIYIHENIVELDTSAFDGCNHLTSITVSENNQYYKSIDGNLYTKDGSVIIQYALGKPESSFVIPDCVEEIGWSAFSYIDNPMSITIPTSVKTIHSGAFYHYDTKLIHIIFENTEGWFIDGEAVDVSDSKQNVLYLTDTYSDNMWYIINDSNDTTPDGDDNGGSGNIEDDDSGNDDDSNEDIEQEIKESPVSYSEFQAEWYAKEFSNFDFSYANEFLTGIENDAAIMLAINTWSGIHIVGDPSYAIGELSKEDLYVIVIYDLLTGNSGEFENPMDLFKNDSTDYMYDAVKILFGTSDVEMDWELLKKIDPTAYKQSMLNGDLFDNLDIVGHVFDTFDNLYDALEACARYQAISNMSEGFKNVLQAIYDDTSNETALRNAALKCMEYFENACNTTMQDILAQEYIEESAEYVLKVFVSESWGFLLKNVFPEAMVVQFAFQGVAILGDTLFNLDATTEAFYQLKVVVGFENAIRKILENNEFDYSNTEKCSNYLYAVETFQRTVLLGLDYSAALLQSRVESIGMSDTLKQEYLSQIETIEDIKADRLETYLSFENISQRMYQAYCNLEDKGAKTPVTALMLSLGVGSFSFEGNYYMLFDNICGSMEEAKAFCENIGGHLAIIDSQEENDAVYSGLVSLGYRNAFFGLTDSQKEGTWLTVTGNSPTYTNWHSGEPNSESSSEDWAMFYWKYTNGQWNDGNFTGTVSGGKAFICEWD